MVVEKEPGVLTRVVQIRDPEKCGSIETPIRQCGETVGVPDWGHGTTLPEKGGIRQETISRPFLDGTMDCGPEILRRGVRDPMGPGRANQSGSRGFYETLQGGA